MIGESLRRLRGAWRSGLGIYLAIATTAAFALSVPFLVQAKAFAFVDIGSDTFYQFYPLQVAVARQLKALHEVTWCFDLGLGGFIGTLFDPFWLVTGWLPDSWQLALRLPMFWTRLLLAGAFFYGYLRQIGIRTPLAVLGGLGYGFSSYGTLNAQWEALHGTEFLQFAVYLFLLERHLSTRSKWFAVGAGAAVGLGNAIGLYMFALFSLLYLAVRARLDPEPRRTLLGFVTFAAWALVGLILVAPLLLPSVWYLAENPRVSGEHSQLSVWLSSLLTLNDASVVSSQLAGFVGKDLMGSNLAYRGWGNYFEGPGFYVGLLPLLGISQLLGPRAARGERMLAVLAIAGVALYIALPALRYAVYGFAHSSFRFSTVWISALVLVCGLLGLQRAGTSGWWLPGLVAAALLVAVGPAASVQLTFAALAWTHALTVAAFAGMYVGIVLATRGEPASSPPRSAAYLLVAAGACELVCFAMPAIDARDAVALDPHRGPRRYHDGSEAALALIAARDAEPAFHRIEKSYQSVFLGDALVQDYAGTASYYFHASGVTRFVDRLDLPRPAKSPNYISPMVPRPRILDLLAVRYLLTRQRSLDGDPQATYLGTADGVDVYRRESALPFGAFFDRVVSETEADSRPVPERDQLLLQAAVVEQPERVREQLAKLGTVGSPKADARPAGSSRIERINDTLLVGTVQSPAPALLLLQIPFDRGWTARLDDRDLSLLRADYGLSAALVPPGAHRIALSYRPPGRDLGMALAAGAVVFLGVLGLGRRRHPARSQQPAAGA